MAVWTGQWRLADTPCARLWPPCGAAEPAPPPHPTCSSEKPCGPDGAQLAPNWGEWDGRVCTNEPFECRLAAVMERRKLRFEFLKAPRGEPRLVAALVRMPERDRRTGAYDPNLWHQPLGMG